MALIDFLIKAQTDMSDDQGSWRQFILDHLDYIERNSTTYDIDEPLMQLYRYDLNRFLKDYLKRNVDLGWIVLLINNLANDFQFDQAGKYVIPLDETISALYHRYRAIVSNAN